MPLRRPLVTIFMLVLARLGLLVALTACGGATGQAGGATPPRATPAPTAALAPEPESPSATSVEPLPAATPSAPRLEVARPADLASALQARRPTIELVPQSCGRSRRAVEVTDERVCVQDETTGLTRAMRRFATDTNAIRAARTGDDVVFAVKPDADGAITRYAGRIWRWDLREDRYLGLVGATEDYYSPAASVSSTDFGALVVDAAETRHWVFVNGALERVRPFDFAIDELTVIEGRTYLRETAGSQETLSIVGRQGPRVTTERVARYPVATHLPLRIAFPDGRPLVISVFPRGEGARVHVVRPPATEVRTLDVAIARPRTARMVDEALELESADGRFLVDLATAAVRPSEGPPPAERAEPPTPRPGSFYALVPSESALVATASGVTFELGAQGVRAIEGDPPAARRSGCRCTEDALVCGEAAPVAGACTRVEDLERLSALDADYEEREDQPATSYGPQGRFRIDRLETDLVRVTRLPDGERLWVRIVAGAVLAQADDGAFWAPEGASLEGYALRWGRSLLDAPVSELARHRDAFYRASLVSDFFAGRALPAADTTLPTAGTAQPTTSAPCLDVPSGGTD